MTKTTKTNQPTATRAPCACGCGETPQGRRARFRPGHDARLRGVLLRAAEAAGPDATADERTAAEAAVGALPDREWAERWWAARHPADAERAAERASRWDV